MAEKDFNFGTSDRKVFTVKELADLVNDRIKPLRDFYVKGEIRRIQPYARMAYMTLADPAPGGQTEAVFSILTFFSDLSGDQVRTIVNRSLEGQQVQVLVRYVNFYAPKGSISAIVREIVPEGEGAIAYQRALLIDKLTKEGLIDETRKKPVPDHPRVVGVVTSRRGAAIRDFMRIARDPSRLGALVVLAHASVEGQKAPAEVSSALRALDSLTGQYEPDVIVLTRGGGSVDDLAAFDSEEVARTVAACKHPVISAIGHERDTVVTDYVADLRAATPTHAAELVFPEKKQYIQRVTHLMNLLDGVMNSIVNEASVRLERLRYHMVSPRQQLDEKALWLQELQSRLNAGMVQVMRTSERSLEGLGTRMARLDPSGAMDHWLKNLEISRMRLENAITRHLERSAANLQKLEAGLQSLDPKSPLRRGYAMVKLKDGSLLRTPQDVSPGDPLEIYVHGGTVDAQVVSGRQSGDSSASPGSRGPAGSRHRSRDSAQGQRGGSVRRGTTGSLELFR